LSVGEVTVPRGRESPIGTERKSPNGYLYRKTEKGWQTVHTLVVEERLGRPLKESEYVRFCDGNKSNLDPNNLVIGIRGKTSLRRRAAVVESRIRELQAVLAELQRRIEIQDNI
jgi:hypothetical protein